MDVQTFKIKLKENRGYIGYKKNSENEKIENFMLYKILELLRPLEGSEVVARRKQNLKLSMEYEEEFSNENAKFLNNLKESTSNYKIHEMILYIMSCAHDNYIKTNCEKIIKNNPEKMYQLAPFKMQNWDDIEKYYSVLCQILDALNVNYETNQIKEEFNRQQIIFFINNGIYDKERIKENIGRSEELNPALSRIKNENGNLICEILDNKSISNCISKQLAEKLDLNMENRIKQAFINSSKEVGIINVPDKKKRMKSYKVSKGKFFKMLIFTRTANPKPGKPVTKMMYKFARHSGIIFVKNLNKYNYKYCDEKAALQKSVKFIPYEQCTAEQKKQIEKREKKINKFIEKVENSGKNEIGTITMISPNNENKNSNNKPEIIQINVSQKDLINMRVLPEEIGWEREKRALVKSENSVLLIAEKNKKKNFKEGIIINNKNKGLNNEQQKVNKDSLKAPKKDKEIAEK